MAIEIPSLVGFNAKTFKLMNPQQVNPSGEAGFVQTIKRASPYWMAEYSTPSLRDAKLNAMIAFQDALEGALGTFLAYDPYRPGPYAYKHLALAAQATAWGTPTIVNYDYAASTIRLTGALAGSTITVGDYISLNMAGIWYLFRAQETRNFTAGMIDLIVKPRPNFITFASGTPLRYVKACAEMKVLGEFEEINDIETLGTSYKFRAFQVIARNA